MFLESTHSTSFCRTLVPSVDYEPSYLPFKIMIRTQLRPIRSVLAIAILLLIVASHLQADPVVYIAPGSDWAYFRGLSAPSDPIEEWKEPDFDDSSWTTGQAPFGYDDGPFGTDLSALNPPMEDNYSALFLRQSFVVSDASQVAGLTAMVDYDDGFIMWINGDEVLRRNATGDKDHEGFADSNHESGTIEEYDLPDPDGYLVDGENVVAVIIMNNQISSSDLRFDIDISDPFGPDLTPPLLAGISPGGGTIVRSLSQIDITFDEEVTGVDASDLLIDGVPASSVSGTGAGPYEFTFDALDPGNYTVGWVNNPGITDLSEAVNPFTPNADWTYEVDPDAPEAQLVISEFLASNVTGITDEDGDRSDWFEVTNIGDTVADLGGWSVSDDETDPSQWIFPSRTLEPGDRLIVYASGKDRRPSGNGELHTNFKLRSSGDFLGLFTNAVPRIPVSQYSPNYPEQRSDLAYGIGTGGQIGYLDPPTPGENNGAIESINGIVSVPIASHDRGFYVNPFDLQLSAVPSDANIRYTLNGSEPTTTQGTLYSESISVAPSTSRAVITVKAIAYKTGYLPSTTVTWTYIYPEFVSDQPANPSGFPNSWRGAPAADYGMDPQVVDDPAYSASMVEALTQIPSLSIVMSINDMFGNSGLYPNPGGEGVNWERGGSVEILHPDGKEAAFINCGVRMHGGASRSPSKSPKHSFRLLFKGIYGPTKLNYPLFEGSPVDSFDTVILRSNYNNSWIHWDSGQRSRGQMIRDQWVRDTHLEMSGFASRGRYVHLYLNGLYWGVYNLVERPSAPMAAEHLGGEKEEYDALNSANPVDGNSQAWSQLLSRSRGNVSSTAGYLSVLEYLEPNHFADYMLVNFFGANADWPSHNWYAVRRRAPNQPWYFMSWDAERIFESTSSNRINANNGNSPGEVFQDLRANADFRLKVADRAHRHLFNGGALTTTSVRERWLNRADQIDKAAIAESARWGDYRRDVHSSSNGPYEFYRMNSHYIPEKNRLLNSYFPQRPGIFLNQLRSANLYPNVGAPVFSQHGGQIPGDFQLNMSRPQGTSGTIYYTLNGDDPREFGTGSVSDSAENYTGSVPIDGFAHVKARIRSGTTWSALTEATFYISSDVSPLRISEIHFNPIDSSESEFVELWNSGSHDLNLSGLQFTTGITFTFPEGTSLAPDERIVLVSSLTDFENDHPGITPLGQYEGRLDNGGENLRIRNAQGDEILEVEYNDGDGWPLGADGFGYTLVLRSEEADPRRPESWRASQNHGGTPGDTDAGSPEDLIFFNEVLVGGTGVFEDAIELRNFSDEAVDVSGWFVSDVRETASSLKKYQLPAGSIIPAEGYLAIYEQDFATGPANSSIELAPEGGRIFLSSANGSENLTGHIVRLSYEPVSLGRSFGLYLTSQGYESTSLERPTFGVDSPSSLPDFRTGEGDTNAAPANSSVVINEIHYNPSGGYSEFIELRNLTNNEFSLFDSDLDRGWMLRGISDITDTQSFEFSSQATIPPLGYALVVSVDPSFFRSINNVPAEVPIYGPYKGALDNAGERLTLLQPGTDADEQVQHVIQDSVRFNDRSPWDEDADGSGPSLERRLATEFADDPLNWGASDDPGGTPGADNSVSGPGGNLRPTASFTFEETGLALTIAFDASTSSDPEGAISEYHWSFGDGSDATGVEVEHTFPLPGDYDVLLQVTDAGGLTSSSIQRVTLEFAGGQIPGDGNQDGVLDMSDALHFLNYLYLDSSPELPCGDTEGSRVLLDTNGDSFLDLGDAIYTLIYLYRDGNAAPALGEECVAIQGCPEICAP